MIVTHKTAQKLQFPCYMLPSDNWEYVDKILFIDGQVLDDKNMKGETLGRRRLETPFRSLFPLKDAVIDFIGLVKQRNKFFIDNKGRPFIYEKLKLVPLKYHQIQKISRRETASTVKVRGIRTSFIVPRPPAEDYQWAGILYYNGVPWKLYEYSDEKLKDTRRKI